MTVQPVNGSQDRGSSKEVFSVDGEKIFGKRFVEAETDQESAGSSEEMESPRSVAKTGRWTAKNIAYVHSQVLRIREEDSHIGEEIGEGLSAKDKIYGVHRQQIAPPRVDVVLFSKPILPASRLSGKTVH